MIKCANSTGKEFQYLTTRCVKKFFLVLFLAILTDSQYG